MELSAGRASPEAPLELPTTPPPAAPRGTADVLEWKVSPWRENRAGAVVAAACALALWLLAAWLLPGEPLIASLLGLAVLGALAPGMAPIQCRVDEGGVARRVLFAWDRRAWSQIRRARVGAAGLFVSPFPSASRWDRFRGLYLPVPRQGTGHAEILPALRREVSRHGF